MSRNSKALAFLFFALPALTTTHAQQRQEVFRILGISVEGQRSSDPTAIIANTGLKVGDEITVPGEQTRQAIQRLYNLRLFDDVQIFIENRVQDGVYLLIRVKENPRLEKIEISGNDELSEDDILKKINLVKGQIVTKQDLASIKRLLKKQYETDGYLNATVNAQLPPTPEDSTGRRVVLKITVDEGPKVKVDRIRFHGNKQYDDGDLKGEMKDTDERKWWKFWSSNKFDPKKYQSDKDLIIVFYRKNGYRDAEIISDSLQYDQSKKYLTIDIYMTEGAQYKVRNILWEGNTVYTSDLLNERLGLKPGEIYNRQKLDENLHRNEAGTDIASLYYDIGYLLFQVDPDEVKVAADSIDLVLKMKEGKQFRLGKVIIAGNSKTYEKVIRRELHTRPGDFFSREAIMRSVRQLSQLNYFNPEKIKPDPKNMEMEKGTVDLEYSVEEKSSDTFNMSVGYSAAFGFNGGFGLTFNNFSLTEPFRGGAGQQLTFDWQFGVSTYYRTFSIGFQEPWLFDTPTLFGINLYDTQTIYSLIGDVRTTGVNLRIGRRLKWPDYLFRGDWSIRFQRIETNTGSDFFPAGNTNQVALTQVISRNSTDSPIFPSRGSNFSLSTEISGGPFFPGTARFHKHVLSADWYVPVLNSSRVSLTGSTILGLIFPFEKDSYIPSLDYFRMGGVGLGQVYITPLRGYEDGQVGSRTVSGLLIPGKTMIKHTAELRFALALNPIPIYTLLFAEAGNTWQNHTVMDPLDLKRSAGFGVRLLVNPIGLIGFDYGYGFDDVYPADGKPDGWKFHLQFGRNF